MKSGSKAGKVQEGQKKRREESAKKNVRVREERVNNKRQSAGIANIADAASQMNPLLLNQLLLQQMQANLLLQPQLQLFPQVPIAPFQLGSTPLKQIQNKPKKLVHAKPNQVPKKVHQKQPQNNQTPTSNPKKNGSKKKGGGANHAK